MSKEKIDKYLGFSTITIVEAMQRIDSNGKGILFIVNEDRQLVGCLSDGDIRRWLIRTGDLHHTIEDIMNKEPIKLYEKDKEHGAAYFEEYSLEALPIVDSNECVLDIVFQSNHLAKETNADKNALVDIPVIIMAGGKGTRLYPYTKILPKPLIPIGDIPIVERIIDKFCEYGASQFFMTVNYKKGMIKSYFSEHETDYQISYVDEDKPLGTAGSISLIDREFDKPVIVTNCDILIQADYKDIYEYHIRTNNVLTMVAALKTVVVPYGVLNTKEDGLLASMEEKPNLSYFVNTGMYIVNGDALKKIPKDTFFHMTDLAESLMQEGCRVGIYPVSEDSFLDMGEFSEMKRMEEKLNTK